jgi:2-polyprenyl-3-methyl-5-hydroxy-6-metoxy-1,4-benzoquinol methylase
LAKAGFNVTGIDIDPGTIASAKQRHQHKRLTFQCASLEATDISTFDMLVLTEVLEHVPSYDSFMQLISSSMEHSSGLILTVPNGHGWTERLCRPSYRIKHTVIGKPIVALIKTFLGASDVTTANKSTPHVHFFNLDTLHDLFTRQALCAIAAHGAFRYWTVYETFFSDHKLPDATACNDYAKSQAAPLQNTACWAFLLNRAPQ